MKITLDNRPYVIHKLDCDGAVYACDDFERATFTRDENLIREVTDPDHPNHNRAKRKFYELFNQ